MASQQQKKDGLLELLPRDKLSKRQKELHRALLNGYTPTYRFLREPTRLDEFDWENYRYHAIWRENETFICVIYGPYWGPEIRGRNVFFQLDNVGKVNLNCVIYGTNDAAIAETMSFFWSLKHPEHAQAALRISACIHLPDFEAKCKFDFACLQADQLIQILEANPRRQLQFEPGTWTPEQAVILASRSFPMHLIMAGDIQWDDYSKDDGGYLIETIANRQSSFGSLSLDLSRGNNTFIDRAFTEELIKLDLLEKLTLGILNEELGLLPFSAKAKALNYTITHSAMQPNDFDSLDIAMKRIHLSISSFRQDDDAGVLFVAFFLRIAQLGHFEHLGISLKERGMMNDTESVVQALIHAINNNPRLTHLALGDLGVLFSQGPHSDAIFHSFEKHEALRVINLEPYIPNILDGMTEDEYGHFCKPYYAALERLLSRNRNLVVLDSTDEKISNGTTIEKLYALNHFYSGSEKLIQESDEVRHLLVGRVLTERAFANFQYLGLLLSIYTDLLFEMVDGTS
ncbi:hypothetical protein FisN_10Hh404 [Fistulifera solaris]|uniref:Uncharacterized protein n=1 Tax=Fistulifera solaris TaxID=1519565 RepID=A0A1Z5JQS9_FISSO|nr:hypothetical protein FisN_10Hh404 [Fistulifera solaris]|eukprot:GAX16380.1 hypothetical protein FisN_10Hh404 [Fistulifera solaris]